MKDAAEAGFFRIRTSPHSDFQTFWGKMTLFLKKAFLVLPIALGGFLVIIFAFGSADPIQTEIAPKVPTIRTESVLSLKSYQQIVPTNATQGIATGIAKELIAQNPNGPQLTENGRQIASLDPEELVQKALEDAFSDLHINDLRPTIATSELIIIQSSEPKVIETYLRTVDTILTESFPKTLTINRNEPQKTDFAGFVLAFDKASAALSRVAIPRPFVPLHQELISLMGAQRNTFNLIKNYDADPAQAAVALEAGDEFGRELINIFAAMNTYATENGIIIAKS